MKHRMLTVLLAAVLVIVLVLGGKFLYRHFVTDRIMDGGDMENPYAQTFTNQED